LDFEDGLEFWFRTFSSKAEEAPHSTIGAFGQPFDPPHTLAIDSVRLQRYLNWG